MRRKLIEGWCWLCWGFRWHLEAGGEDPEVPGHMLQILLPKKFKFKTCRICSTESSRLSAEAGVALLPPMKWATLLFPQFKTIEFNDRSYPSPLCLPSFWYKNHLIFLAVQPPAVIEDTAHNQRNTTCWLGWILPSYFVRIRLVQETSFLCGCEPMQRVTSHWHLEQLHSVFHSSQ